MEAWERLGSDLTELILSYLPIETLVRAAAVCRLWRSAVSSPTFRAALSAKKKPPWFFLYGHNNVFFKTNQAFAFDPDSFRWLHLPFPPNPAFFAGAGGFVFASASKFSFAPILSRDGLWREVAPLHVSRCNPLVGVFDDETTPFTTRVHAETASCASARTRFIVVGGVRYVGGLVDIEDRLEVEIYDPNANSWELCPPLPAAFRAGGNSSQWLTSAIFRSKFYVFGICSSFVSSFDLRRRSWGEVGTLRPPGVRFSFLIGTEGMLVLAGMRFTRKTTSFNLWAVHEDTMEFSELGRMPEELLGELFDGGEGGGGGSGGDYYNYDKFATLKCVGLGNLIFVFNEEHYKKFPTCVCEIIATSGSGSGFCEIKWRRVPILPCPVNQFHKVISFCSAVSINSLFV